MARDDGGAAFPQVETDAAESRKTGQKYSHVYSYGGMTLRDHFAGQALAGMYASGGHRDIAAEIFREQRAQEMSLTPVQIGHAAEKQIAQMAYATADAMLAERTK